MIGGPLRFNMNSVGVFPSALVGDSMLVENSDDHEKRQFVGESICVQCNSLFISRIYDIIQDLR